jgi:Na+/melibiose symporter-like transporter
MMLSGGMVLIIIAIILGAVQHFNMANIYGSVDNKWYFWALVAIIGIIGIILAVWGYMKSETMPAKPATTQ